MEGCYQAVAVRAYFNDAHLVDEGGEYVLRSWLGVCREKYGDTDERTLEGMDFLGALMMQQGKHSEAGELFRESLAARRAALGPKHKRTLKSMNQLATLLQEQGNLAGAVPLMREALVTARATLGPQHDNTLSYMSNLADALSDLSELNEAEALYRDSRGPGGVACHSGPPAFQNACFQGRTGVCAKFTGQAWRGRAAAT